MSNCTVGEFVDRARPLGKRLEAELLLAEVLKISREHVFAHPERALTGSEFQKIEALWRRLEAGEPLAYLLGRKEFYGLEFVVDSRVLVPRPETEHLVAAVLELVKGVAMPRILDVGTGCGAIAVALAHASPEAVIFASDVSEGALQIARRNAARLLDVSDDFSGAPLPTFFHSDLLRDIPWQTLELDVLVANLPYIGTEEFHFVEAAVDCYEPSVALYGGVDGLRLYNQLFEQINCSINGACSPRWILGEFGCLQRERLETMIYLYFPGAMVSFHADAAGLDRFFIIDTRYVEISRL